MLPFSFSERDLDMIQLEELHAENGYADWFADRIGLTGHKFVVARHSVWATVNGVSGETDILAVFCKDGTRTAVLIEDKISATFTHKQAERYVERGEYLLQKNDADAFKTVLVAPQQYMESVPNSAPWHKKIAIEELVKWFQPRTDYHARWCFEALVDIIKKVERNQLASSENVAQFGRDFSQYLKDKHAPNLSHKPGKDKSGPTIHFPGSSEKKMLWWKVSKNQMTLQLGGEYQGLVKNLELPVGIEIDSESEKTDYLVSTVPAVDFAKPLMKQISVVEEALGAAKKLINVIPQLEKMLHSKIN